MEELSLFDQLFNEDDDATITIYNADGEGIEMTRIFAYPVFEGDDLDKVYAILQPVNYKEMGMASDEALVFEYLETEEGEVLQIVEDEEVAASVFDYYNSVCEEN